MLVNPANGLKVQGWMARMNENGEMTGDPSGTTEDIIIPIYGKVEARETANVRYASNLDSRAPIVPENATGRMMASAGITTNIDTYDNLGNAHRMTVTF